MTVNRQPRVALLWPGDAERLTTPKAYAVLQRGVEPSEALAEELIIFAKGKLPSFKMPRWIEFPAELPKTATGKIQRFALRATLSV